MDVMLIDGQTFAFNRSCIDGIPSSTVVAMLDSGYSYPPLPPPAVDAIYGGILGAVYDTVAGWQVVSCSSGTNHPLTQTGPMKGTDTKVTACNSTYQYLTLDPSDFKGFDLILRDPFLRDVDPSQVVSPPPCAGTPFR